MTAGHHPARLLRGVRDLALSARLVAVLVPGAFAVGLCLAVALALALVTWP